MRMNLSEWRLDSENAPGVQVGIDNVVIGTSVPEPSAIVLAAVSLSVLLLRRRASRGFHVVVSTCGIRDAA